MKFVCEISLTDILTLITIIATIIFSIIQIKQVKKQVKHEKELNDENERKRVMPFLVPEIKLNVFEEATQKDLIMAPKHVRQNKENINYKLHFDFGKHIMISLSKSNKKLICMMATSTKDVLSGVEYMFNKNQININDDEVLRRLKVISLKNLGDTAYDVVISYGDSERINPRIEIDSKENKELIFVLTENEADLNFKIYYKDKYGNKYVQKTTGFINVDGSQKLEYDQPELLIK